jgi:uncharacterized protein (TIGR03086 family)
MTGARPAATLTGGVALLERAVGYTLGQLSLVSPASAAMLARPTPCAQWDLRALLVHLNDSLAALGEALNLHRVDLGAAPPGVDSPGAPGGGGGLGGADPAAELVGSLRRRARRLLAALATTHDVPVSIGGRLLSTSIVTSAGAIDVAVHGWDAGRACGSGQPIPDRLAADMLAITPVLVSSADRPARFAAPVRVPAGASTSDKLVAYLGRDPA